MKKLKLSTFILLLVCLAITLTVSLTSCKMFGGSENTPDAHHHELRAVAEVKATCTENGVGAYYSCSGCGKLFADAEGKKVISSPEVIRALGHNWDDKVTEDETGAYYVCNNGCGERLEYSEQVELTLMSFNIRLNTSSDGNNAWPNRKTNVINYINGADFDVMCLQEVVTSQYEDIKAGLASKYTIIHYERQGAGSEGLAIIYNNETFNLVEQNRFWLSATPEIQSLGWGASYYRICVNLLLEHKETGAKIDVYNVHLDHKVETARINGIDLILERSTRRGYPLVLAGDFNCTNTTETFFAADKALKDCQTEATRTEYGVTYNGFQRVEDTDNGDAIDFIFVDEANMTPALFEIIDEYPSATGFYSDHFAIKSVVNLKIDERATKDYEREEYFASVESNFASDKEHSLDMTYGSGYGWSVTTNGTEDSSLVGGISTLNASGKYVDYEFYLKSDAKVDLVFRLAANASMQDMSSQLVITVDGIPVNVEGVALSTEYQALVIKNIDLKAGIHHFTLNVVANGGVKVEKLTVNSESEAIFRSSFVTGADIYLENGKIYYTLTFENNGYTADEYVFFNDGGVVVDYIRAEVKDGYITFTFDFTDGEIGFRFNPHALVGGKVYVNGGNTNGDVMGEKLIFSAEELALGNKLFKLFKNHSMPAVDVLENKKSYVFDVEDSDPFSGANGFITPGASKIPNKDKEGFAWENNQGSTYTTTIIASDDAVVTFLIKIVKENGKDTSNALFDSVTLGGKAEGVTRINDTFACGSGWGAGSVYSAKVATLNLKKGENTISFTMDANLNYNIVGIEFLAFDGITLSLKSSERMYTTPHSADIFIAGDRVYYELTFENYGYDPTTYSFFYYEANYTYESYKVNGNLVTFRFDITDYATHNYSLPPHLKINGVYHGHKNGDVLLTVNTKSVKFGGRTYTLYNWYDMPTIKIEGTV